jgi:hypothetical protein
MCQLLIENNADVNVSDNDRRTPLLHATAKEDRSIVELLLSHSANPLARSLQGKSPFSLAKAEIADLFRRVIEQDAEQRAAGHDKSAPIDEEESEDEEEEKPAPPEAIQQSHEEEEPLPEETTPGTTVRERERRKLTLKERKEFQDFRAEIAESLAALKAHFDSETELIVESLRELRREVIERKRRQG